MNTDKFQDSSFKGKMKTIVSELNSMRNDSNQPTDVSLEQHLADSYSVKDLNQFYSEIGFDPNFDTIQNIFTMPDDDVRWLVPEIFRTAISQGLRSAPIWNNLIAAEQTVRGTEIKMPHFEMSDAAPKYVGEAETIPVGTIAYGQKSVSIRKIGRGIKISDEVRDYVSVNIVSLFLRDFGIKLGHAMDVLLIDTLINGEQSDGSASAPVIGVATANTLLYKDYLKIFVRMARLGRTPDTMVAGEDMAIETMDLAEFKDRASGTTEKKLNLKTPVPNSTNFFIHGNIPDDHVLIIDTSSAVIKLNAKPLMVEGERIVSNQTTASYASLTTGFATLYRDARVQLDMGTAIGSAPIPSWMDPSAQENTVIS